MKCTKWRSILVPPVIELGMKQWHLIWKKIDRNRTKIAQISPGCLSPFSQSYSGAFTMRKRNLEYIQEKEYVYALV